MRPHLMHGSVLCPGSPANPTPKLTTSGWDRPGAYYPAMGERKGALPFRVDTVRKDIMDDDLDDMKLDEQTLVSPEEFLNCSGPPLRVERAEHTHRCPDDPDAFKNLPPVEVDRAEKSAPAPPCLLAGPALSLTCLLAPPSAHVSSLPRTNWTRLVLPPTNWTRLVPLPWSASDSRTNSIPTRWAPRRAARAPQAPRPARRRAILR